jgi:hypothetical protein
LSAHPRLKYQLEHKKHTSYMEDRSDDTDILVKMCL